MPAGRDRETAGRGVGASPGRKRVEHPNVDSILDSADARRCAFKPDGSCKDDPRVQLDFNSVAKGYTVDLLAALVEKYGAEITSRRHRRRGPLPGCQSRGEVAHRHRDPFRRHMSNGEYLQKRIWLLRADWPRQLPPRFYLDAEGNKVAHHRPAHGTQRALRACCR